ncbi:MAG: tRNA pseudouridine(38-40) synthase TruA [Chloroflexi bacterium]|nr:tRNA pseudouridine(38-40) synthase TruA [Chloroflexota bacterium]
MLTETVSTTEKARKLENRTAVALLLEYKGTHYHGFQLQANACTIQEELESALERLTGEKTRVKAASRTDAGVHARNQVVMFRTFSPLPMETFVKGLNFYLPKDIAVKEAVKPREGFDPRRRALGREYRYTILNSPTTSPLLADFAYWVPQYLDVEAMVEASRSLPGVNDFAPFSGPLEFSSSSTVRRVDRVGVERKGRLVVFTMVASSFLPQQVRRTVGALMEVGVGRMSVEGFHMLTRSKTRGLAGPVLPAHGLCLIRVNYPETIFVNGHDDEDL